MEVPRKRKELRRSRLRRKTGLKNRTPMRKRNAKRATARRARDFGKPAELVRRMPCCNCGAAGKSDPHHEPPRSRGGTKDDLCALCRTCHNARHAAGSLAAFMAAGGVDLRREALKVRALLVEEVA